MHWDGMTRAFRAQKLQVLGMVAVFFLLPVGALAGGPTVESSTDGRTFEVRCTSPCPADTLVFDQLQGYDRISLPDGGAFGELGQPLVPTRIVRIALPADMAVTGLTVLSADAAGVPGTYTLIPAQPPRRVADGPASGEFVAPDPQAYASQTQYPGTLAEFELENDLAGQAMAVVRFYPVQYVPAEGRVIVYTSITIALEGTSGYVCGDYLPPQVSESGRAAYEQMVSELVVNPEDVVLRTAADTPAGARGVSAGDYDYVIITQSAWVSNFQPLADWKTKKGVPATIVTTDWIYNSGGYSGTNQAKIRAFVSNANSVWGATWFLLGGDTGVVPAQSTMFSSVDSEAVVNDTYYADFDGDWVCEVNVGRASVTSTSAITTFINKIFTYEKNPPLTAYAKTAAFFGFDLSYGGAEGGNTKTYIKNNYVPSSWTYRKVYDTDSGDHKSNVISNVNLGNNLINHIDHSSETSMGVGYTNHDLMLENGDVDNFSNGDRQSTWYSIGCWACAYDFDAAIAEHFVRDTNGGGVAFVGNNRYGWFMSGTSDGYSLRFDRYFFRSLFSQNHYKLGECVTDHRNDSVENDDYYHYIYTELTLLGDPELPIWTEDPLSLTVSHAATLNVGQTTAFSVQVNSGGAVSGATVCLWKSGDVYQIAQTNASGTATFSVTPASTGTLYVTTTKRNYLPSERTAGVVSPINYTLTVNVTGQGSVVLDPPGGTYSSGTTVQLTANAADGWHFDHWTGALSGSVNPTMILMDANKTVGAVFLANGHAKGDLNCDDVIDNFDINPFVLALTNATGYAAAYPACDIDLADVNDDGVVDNFDINPFVALLTGG